MLGKNSDVCEVCKSERSIVRLELAHDLNAQMTEVHQCRSCLAIFNGRAYSLLDEHSRLQDIQRTDLYVPKELDPSALHAHVREKGSLLDYLFAKVSRDWSESVFCDFGGGNGLVAIAASDIFKTSILCDMDERGVNEICGAIGHPANLLVTGYLSDFPEKIDVMFMWHVLEHIPEPADFLISIKTHLSENAIFFLQCPAYRKEYLVDCHYVLFNQPSLETLFKLAGIETIEVSYDLDNSFITAIGVLNSEVA
jgi:hypothetical protein